METPRGFSELVALRWTSGIHRAGQQAGLPEKGLQLQKGQEHIPSGKGEAGEPGTVSRAAECVAIKSRFFLDKNPGHCLPM